MSDQDRSSPAAQGEQAEPFHISAEAIAALPQEAKMALSAVDNLKYFLISAPVDWQPGQYIRRFLLPTGEYVSCVLWQTLYHVSGTDIVRCLAFRFSAFGRPVKNTKKFEEGIFSDLRNLKAGTDATLEEPKSPFLDFLYKNNCIRTQKKQKVFYWYSVPHDRLFLDALERDLKREKAGQEPTTVAESEPALSFVCDTSTSLYEQLTKSKHNNSSIFSTVPQTFDAPPSPSMPHENSATPSSSVPQLMHQAPDHGMSDMSSFGPGNMPMTSASAMPMMNQAVIKHEQHSQPAMYQNVPVEVNGFHPAHQRHASVPLYYESSPAPSCYSTQSYYDHPSTRAISYEPMTPPQQPMHYTPEPGVLPADAYRPFSTDNHHQYHHGMQPMNPQFIPTSTPQYTQAKPVHPVNIMYSHIEGSPNYKRRRRSSSISPGPSVPAPANRGAIAKQPHMARRPSDLRRAISVTVAPNMERAFERAVSGPPMSTNNYGDQMFYTPDGSRHGTPLSSIEGPDMMMGHDQFSSPASYAAPSYTSFEPQSAPAGMLRRARSATASYDDFSPSAPKPHCCPIVGCTRKFKRLEHLKRHVRTHTHERPFQCPDCDRSFSRSDNLAQHRRTHETNSAVTTFSDDFDEEDLPSLAEDTSPDLPTGSSFDANEKPFGDSLALPPVGEDLMITGNGYQHIPGSMGPPPLPMGLKTFS